MLSGGFRLTWLTNITFVLLAAAGPSGRHRTGAQRPDPRAAGGPGRGSHRRVSHWWAEWKIFYHCGRKKCQYKNINRNRTAYYPCLFLHLIGSWSHSGENPLPPDDPNKELMGKTEVSLTLANKFDVPGEANAEMDARTLLLKWVHTIDFRLIKKIWFVFRRFTGLFFFFLSFQHQEAHRGCDPVPAWGDSHWDPGLHCEHRTGQK